MKLLTFCCVLQAIVFVASEQVITYNPDGTIKTITNTQTITSNGGTSNVVSSVSTSGTGAAKTVVNSNGVVVQNSQTTDFDWNAWQQQMNAIGNPAPAPVAAPVAAPAAAPAAATAVKPDTTNTVASPAGTGSTNFVVTNSQSGTGTSSSSTSINTGSGTMQVQSSGPGTVQVTQNSPGKAVVTSTNSNTQVSSTGNLVVTQNGQQVANSNQQPAAAVSNLNANTMTTAFDWDAWKASMNALFG